MPGHFPLPIGQACPRAHIPYLVGSAKQSAGVGNRAAAHGAAVEDSDMVGEAHVEEAAKPEPRPPEPSMQRPTSARQILPRPASDHFHDRDSIPLLSETQCGHAAAKPRSDNDEIKNELPVRPHRVSWTAGCGAKFSCGRARAAITS